MEFPGTGVHAISALCSMGCHGNVSGVDVRFISVLMYYISTHKESRSMRLPKGKLMQHIPVLIALLYFATGDYLSLMRQVRLLF
jgi:hypothetical protein